MCKVLPDVIDHPDSLIDFAVSRLSFMCWKEVFDEVGLLEGGIVACSLDPESLLSISGKALFKGDGAGLEDLVDDELDKPEGLACLLKWQVIFFATDIVDESDGMVEFGACGFIEWWCKVFLDVVEGCCVAKEGFSGFQKFSSKDGPEGECGGVCHA